MILLRNQFRRMDINPLRNPSTGLPNLYKKTTPPSATFKHRSWPWITLISKRHLIVLSLPSCFSFSLYFAFILSSLASVPSPTLVVSSVFFFSFLFASVLYS
ncbi:unnamed protein product [Mortierella alpina]